LQAAVDGIVTDLESAGSAGSQEGATAIEALLRRLVEDLGEIKLELRRARSERLEDLTLVVDLLTTSWRAVDRRLERIDRKVERLAGPPGLGPRSRLPYRIWLRRPLDPDERRAVWTATDPSR